MDDENGSASDGRGNTLSEAGRYVGRELELFRDAVNWKRYWGALVRRYLRGDVLEVGAGIGSNTALLRSCTGGRWVCLEPDPDLASGLRAALPHDSRAIELVAGTTACLARREHFDSIMYLDVLEHIADDREELARAAELLRPGGHLVVLAPAHQYLYSAFDAAIGHHRRYDARSLAAVVPQILRPVSVGYLDSMGLFASLANRTFLKQTAPTPAQLTFWDRVVVRGSRILDPVLRHRWGKSVLGVWRKPPAHAPS